MCLPPWIYYGVDRRETPSSLPCANILHCFKISCQLLKVNIRVSSFSGVIILSRLKCLWILNLSTKVLVLHEVTLWATASQLHINCSGARTSREKTQRGKWRSSGDLLRRALRSPWEGRKDSQATSYALTPGRSTVNILNNLTYFVHLTSPSTPSLNIMSNTLSLNHISFFKRTLLTNMKLTPPKESIIASPVLWTTKKG